MSTPKYDPIWVESYTADMRYHIRTLLAWGYADTRDQVCSDSEEQEITEFISEAIKCRLGDPKRPRWCAHYYILEDNPVPTRGRTGKRRVRPDIIVVSMKIKNPQFVIEAKPLNSRKKYGVTYYLNSGLKRFIDELYAGNFPEAGMLGYVQTENVDYWIARIKAAIDADAASGNALHLRSPHCDVPNHKTFPREWKSEHDRQSKRPITVFHFLVDCS
jgi:hypothetical protein